MIDTRCRQQIPHPQIMNAWHQQRARETTRFLLVHIGVRHPGITHRRVFVANVSRARLRDDAFGESRRRTDDDIVIGKIERFKCHRIKQERGAMSLLPHQFLHKTGANIPIAILRRHRFRIIERCVNRCIRIHLMKHLDDFLRPTHLHQKVVNDGNFHITTSRTEAKYAFILVGNKRIEEILLQDVIIRGEIEYSEKGNFSVEARRN